jgi:glycosyltransferase involved in cell wall biosynthesis
MEMKKRVSLWSADYTQITGQALVTARVRQHQPAILWREYIYKGRGWRCLITWLSASCRLWLDIALGRVSMIYLICSRSDGGLLRDLPALLARRAGLRIVVHAHGSDIVNLLSSRPISPLARSLYKRCEIIVPSVHLVKSLEDIIGAKPYLCENYFGSNALPRPASANQIDCDRLTVLWNSNVMASKGFFDVAKAIQHLYEEGLRVKMVSLGEPLGDDEMTCREATRRLGAIRGCGWLDYRGKVGPAKAIALTAEADVICFPSRYVIESQAMAVIEGMCTGKAIVVTDIPALRATLGGYPAHFVPVHSVSAIIEALRELDHLKRVNAVAFVSSRLEAAAAARERFAMARFDEEMATILHEGAGGLE